MTLTVDAPPVEIPAPRPAEPSHGRIIPEHKTAWVDALRSGRFIQFFGEYRGKTSMHRCAMGVVDYLAVGDDSHWDRDRVAEWLGLTHSDFEELIEIIVTKNDDKSETFGMIADYIEREW